MKNISASDYLLHPLSPGQGRRADRTEGKCHGLDWTWQRWAVRTLFVTKAEETRSLKEDQAILSQMWKWKSSEN